nr:hypothetical protein [Halomonas sp. 1513]
MRVCLVSETWTPDINGVAHTLDQLSQPQIAERFLHILNIAMLHRDERTTHPAGL